VLGGTRLLHFRTPFADLPSDSATNIPTRCCLPLELHDVSNAERLVARIIARASLNLSREDREDLQQFLLLELWKLHQRYLIRQGFGCFATVALRSGSSTSSAASSGHVGSSATESTSGPDLNSSDSMPFPNHLSERGAAICRCRARTSQSSVSRMLFELREELAGD